MLIVIIFMGILFHRRLHVCIRFLSVEVLIFKQQGIIFEVVVVQKVLRRILFRISRLIGILVLIVHLGFLANDWNGFSLPLSILGIGLFGIGLMHLIRLHFHIERWLHFDSLEVVAVRNDVLIFKCDLGLTVFLAGLHLHLHRRHQRSLLILFVWTLQIRLEVFILEIVQFGFDCIEVAGVVEDDWLVALLADFGLVTRLHRYRFRFILGVTFHYRFVEGAVFAYVHDLFTSQQIVLFLRNI
mmetsp:Transcript_68180/g.147012  ORF Transcript_68180/g.147012 Transcript_68180/m.147012 type:complete len:242 (-) Transcript_68180:347-1072(-)